MSARGIEAAFLIDSSGDVMTDVSTYIRNISPSGDVERLDITTLQPDVAAPLKAEVGGFRTRGISLEVLYTDAAYTFFSAIEGLESQDFQFGPNGKTAGKFKISGVANVLNVTMPSAGVDGIKTFTVELSVTGLNANSTF